MVNDGGRPREPGRPSGEREQARIRGRFGVVLFLLVATVFFSVSAPNEPWAWLSITVALSVNLMIAVVASGATERVVRTGLVLAGISVVASVVAVGALGEEVLRTHLAITSFLLTLLTMGALIRRVTQRAEINVVTVLAALCFYVLLGLTFAFVFEAVGELGSRPFFASPEDGTRSDYVYFSFVTMAAVGYGDLAAQGGLGRALAVTEALVGQMYLVTAVAALVGSLGRTSAPRR